MESSLHKRLFDSECDKKLFEDLEIFKKYSKCALESDNICFSERLSGGTLFKNITDLRNERKNIRLVNEKENNRQGEDDKSQIEIEGIPKQEKDNIVQKETVPDEILRNNESDDEDIDLYGDLDMNIEVNNDYMLVDSSLSTFQAEDELETKLENGEEKKFLITEAIRCQPKVQDIPYFSQSSSRQRLMILGQAQNGENVSSKVLNLLPKFSKCF